MKARMKSAVLCCAVVLASGCSRDVSVGRQGRVGAPGGGSSGASGSLNEQPSGGASPDAGGGVPWDVCADVSVQTRLVTPTVVLLIDQSASMEENEFAESGLTRWDALKDALLAQPSGITFDFATRVRFGLTLYSAVSTDDGEDSELIGDCPQLTRVAPAVENYAAIEGVLREADTILETPTSDALKVVVPELVADPHPDPKIIVLATDGDPDTCDLPNPESDENRQRAKDAVIAEIEAARAQDIRTFVIGVGEGSVSLDHLQAVAVAGAGVADAPFWVAGDDAGLRRALEEIIAGEASCTLALRGRVTGDACAGTVTLGDDVLICDDADGWRLIDPTHIELLGAACDALRTTELPLEARFPCDVVEVI